MKIAPIVRALNARKADAAAAGIDLRVSIVHTGQHYDEKQIMLLAKDVVSENQGDVLHPTDSILGAFFRMWR